MDSTAISSPTPCGRGCPPHRCPYYHHQSFHTYFSGLRQSHRCPQSTARRWTSCRPPPRCGRRCCSRPACATHPPSPPTSWRREALGRCLFVVGPASCLLPTVKANAVAGAPAEGARECRHRLWPAHCCRNEHRRLDVSQTSCTTCEDGSTSFTFPAQVVHVCDAHGGAWPPEGQPGGPAGPVRPGPGGAQGEPSLHAVLPVWLDASGLEGQQPGLSGLALEARKVSTAGTAGKAAQQAWGATHGRPGRSPSDLLHPQCHPPPLFAAPVDCVRAGGQPLGEYTVMVVGLLICRPEHTWANRHAQVLAMESRLSNVSCSRWRPERPQVSRSHRFPPENPGKNRSSSWTSPPLA